MGIIVNDLPTAKAFCLDFGLELLGEGAMEEAAPGAHATIELIKYHTPSDENGIQHNTLGIRHVASVVEDIEAVVAKLKDKGTETF